MKSSQNLGKPSFFRKGLGSLDKVLRMLRIGASTAVGFLVILLLWPKETSCLRIRALDVPEVAQVGHDVILSCDFGLDRKERLYQVKWYKGSHEFYRFSPSSQQRVKLFLVENLRVDVQRSDARQVVLRNLHVDMSGRYTCEVSTEHDFETVQATADMLVVALPATGPAIHIDLEPHDQNDDKDDNESGGKGGKIKSGDEKHDKSGERKSRMSAGFELGRVLRANCSSPRSKPAANLAFFVNGRRINSNNRRVELREYVIVNEQDSVETSILAMQFVVRRQHVQRGRIHIRCEASIRHVYKNSKSTNVFVHTHAANLNDDNNGNLAIRNLANLQNCVFSPIAAAWIVSILTA